MKILETECNFCGEVSAIKRSIHIENLCISCSEAAKKILEELRTEKIKEKVVTV